MIAQSPTFGPTTFRAPGTYWVAGILALAFVSGGGASDRGTWDVVTQLLAIPLVAWASLVLLQQEGSRSRSLALGLALFILVTLAIQQIVLMESTWRSVEVRELLLIDLATAGVSQPRFAWSLSPLASERGLWSIFPALGVFLGALAMPAHHHRTMLLLVVGLAVASLLLGFVQLGVPQDSILNPFPEWPASLNGVFANPNHQSTALAVSLVIIAALALDTWRFADEPGALPRWSAFVLLGIGLVMLVALPIVGSRAGVLLACLALVATLVMYRATNNSRAGSDWGRRTRRIGFAAVTLAVVLVAVNWVWIDSVEKDRGPVAKATAQLGADHAPMGAGLGSFVSWFDQAGPEELDQWHYYNHAHNEFVQWWFESGFLGLIAIFGILLLVWRIFPRQRFAEPDGGVAVAAWLGCVVLLLHSAVDYPLRTPALMTVGALLIGIALSRSDALRLSKQVADTEDPIASPSGRFGRSAGATQ